MIGAIVATTWTSAPLKCVKISHLSTYMYANALRGQKGRSFLPFCLYRYRELTRQLQCERVTDLTYSFMVSMNLVVAWYELDPMECYWNHAIKLKSVVTKQYQEISWVVD